MIVRPWGGDRRGRDRERTGRLAAVDDSLGGHLATAGLLVESCTTAPSVAPVNRTVPVAELPPVSGGGDEGHGRQRRAGRRRGVDREARPFSACCRPTR